MKLDFPFLSSTKTYAALCPEQYGGSQSPAELGGLGQHPDSRVLSPFQPVQTRSIGHQSSSASNFATICGVNKGRRQRKASHPRNAPCFPCVQGVCSTLPAGQACPSHSQCPAATLLSQAKPRISGVNALSKFKGSSGKCYQLRANKAKLSLLKLKVLEGKEREVSRLFACGGWCGVGRQEVSDGSRYVMLLLYLSTLCFCAFRLVRSTQQVLWPNWHLSALGRDAFA